MYLDLSVPRVTGMYVDRFGGTTNRFKINAVNLCSAALVATVAIAFFAKSSLFVLLAALTFSAREAFMNHTPNIRPVIRILDFQLWVEERVYNGIPSSELERKEGPVGETSNEQELYSLPSAPGGARPAAGGGQSNPYGLD